LKYNYFSQEEASEISSVHAFSRGGSVKSNAFEQLNSPSLDNISPIPSPQLSPRVPLPGKRATKLRGKSKDVTSQVSQESTEKKSREQPPKPPAPSASDDPNPRSGIKYFIAVRTHGI